MKEVALRPSLGYCGHHGRRDFAESAEMFAARPELVRMLITHRFPIDDAPEAADKTPLWHEAQETPEAQMLRERDADAVRRLIDTLAEPFRETFVLREINNLSYREIADAVGAPVGTVMSRLARARAMLRSAWMAEQEPEK